MESTTKKLTLVISGGTGLLIIVIAVWLVISPTPPLETPEVTSVESSPAQVFDASQEITRSTPQTEVTDDPRPESGLTAQPAPDEEEPRTPKKKKRRKRNKKTESPEKEEEEEKPLPYAR